MIRKKVNILSLAALFFLTTTNVWAQSNCISAGASVEVRSTGVLSGNAPQVFLEFKKSNVRVEGTVVTSTVSRTRIELPSVGLVPNEEFSITIVEPNGQSTVVATAKTCDFATTTTGGGTVDDSANSAVVGRSPFQSATRLEVAAPSGAPEIILIGDAGQVARAEAVAVQAGARILRRRGLPGLGLGMAIIDPQGGLSLSSLRNDLSRRNIAATAGPHHVYGLSQEDPNAFARKLTLGSNITNCRLRDPVRIGLIDGPVDTNHPALRSVRIETSSVLGRRDRPASSDHATGISGLITAEGFGLAQGAQIFSVTAVSRAGTRDLAKLESIAAALDLMVSRNVDIVNMSLAGPSNAALSQAIEMAARRGVIMVASVGNDRRSPVAYPASDPNVIGVTAVDADKRLYRHASRGPGVDFAAPGVDLRVPTGRSGSAFRSGTSYASAVLTAIVAIEFSRNGGDLNSIRRALAEQALDLGGAGPDLDFGFGLAQAAGC